MFLKTVTLDHFWGFPKTFTLNFGEFTTLVGPNNGGKTTILRAIKFAIDVFRLYFGDGEEPAYNNLAGNWHTDLSKVCNRLGVPDLVQFFYGRSRQARAKVTLTFQDGGDTYILSVWCVENENLIQLNLQLNDAYVRGAQNDDNKQAVVKHFYRVEAHFVQPLGTVSPSENEISWPQLMNELAQGRYAETWRNQLHWLSDGKAPEAFQRVVQDVRNYLGDVEVNPPKRSRDSHPPKVVVHYNENGVEHDISAAGGGLRTILSLATALELSPAFIFLFDEPDAHLHSSVQRQLVRFLMERARPNRQIIISTHAPDVIDEVPIDSLVWIDRTKTTGEPCDDVGKMLVHLGAVSHSQAIQSLGADVVLYFEGKPDRNTLTGLMRRCGKDSLVARSRPALLKGFGDSTNLPGALRILKALLPMKVAVAVFRDADYLDLDPRLKEDDRGEVLLFQLPCKELENLLLLTPHTITDAAKKVSETRSFATGKTVSPPSLEQVEEKIIEFTQGEDVKSAIEDQWVYRWLETNGGLTDPGQLGKAREEFRTHWQNVEWRRRCCPGKIILAHLRRWLQGDPWKLTLTLPQLFDAYQPTDDVQEMFDKLEEYVNRATA